MQKSLIVLGSILVLGVAGFIGYQIGRPPARQILPALEPSRDTHKLIHTGKLFHLEVPTYCPITRELRGSTVLAGAPSNPEWTAFETLTQAEYEARVTEYANTPEDPTGAPRLSDGSYLVISGPQDILQELDALKQTYPQAQQACVPEVVVIK